MRRNSPLDELLTALFMIMAIAAVVCFFALEGRTWFLGLGGAAVVLRVVQYVLRYIGR